MASKLSIHLSGYPNNVYDILGKMQPGVVTVFNQSSEMNIDAIRRAVSNVIIVYRQFTNLDYHGSADAFFAELQDTINKLKGRGILWEGINEPAVYNIADADALNAWTVRFAQLMHGVGEKVAGFAWSTGNPPASDAITLADVVAHVHDAARAVDIHAFHEYAKSGGNLADWCRYRVFEAALPPDARKPAAILEAGLDDDGTPRQGGYLDDGQLKLTPQQYLDLLKEYDQRIMQDPYVLGATIYQWGDGSWPSFDLSPTIGLLADYVASAGGGYKPPTPWPVANFPTPGPTWSFDVAPRQITAGQSAQLKWDVEGVRAVYLDSKGVTGHETRTVSPQQTTTYTLTIYKTDGTTVTLTATLTVTVSPQPSGFPVVPSPGNIANLRHFQRPDNDNGIGIHAGLDLRQSSLDIDVPHMVQLGVKWALIAAQDELQFAAAARACWSAGVYPVGRPICKIDGPPPNWAGFVNACKAIGIMAYTQIFNEPTDDREWKIRPGNADLAGIYAAKWAVAANQVLALGGKPGVQLLGKGEWDALVAEVGRDWPGWKETVFILHNYGANHPPDYPYDARNQQDHPGATILDDDTAVLCFLEYAKWMQDSIGMVLPMIGGEGGWEYGAENDNRYPKCEGALHAQWHATMFGWFKSGKLPQGYDLPDYLFSIAPWILTGMTFADSWYDGVLGDKTQTIAAVSGMSNFVRHFSWDGPTPPQPTASFTATPNTIKAGESSLLKWDVDGVQAVYLDGEGVPGHGSKSVTPQETTTYTLKVVALDGTVTTLPQTVMVSVSPPPQPSECFIDPRLTWITVSQGQQAHVKAVWFYDSKPPENPESRYNIRILVKVEDANGRDVNHEPVTQSWPDGAIPHWTEFGQTDFDQSGDSSFDPTHTAGPYAIAVRDARVSGFGLPLKQHVEYLIVFEIQN